MQLYGVRIELKYVFAATPVYKTQKLEELVRLVPTTDCTATSSAMSIDRALRSALVDRVRASSPPFDNTWSKLCVKYGRVGVSDVLAHLTVAELYTQLRRCGEMAVWRTATVVGYLPSTEEHVVELDEALTPTVLESADERLAHPYEASKHSFHIDLLRASNWRRIPWPGNVLEATSFMGECAADPALRHLPFVEFGPPCPQCFCPLGTGARAWTKCEQCGLMEPGASYGKRFTGIRNDPMAWKQATYDEEVNDSE